MDYKCSHMTTDSLIGSVLAGRFHIVERLGEGSVGEVYLAEHTVLGRRYAIKVLKEQFQSNPRLLERFRREALAASRLEHPNIVFISDFGCAEDGRFYLAMEHIEGISLDEMTERALPGVVPLRSALVILRQVCDALGAAHDAGIVHRDLKPENVMVCRPLHGEDEVKILDFGLAKIMVDTELYKLTRRGEIFGTPMYMSPEQARGESLDSRTDIYAFGVLAYELFTGKPPFDSDTLEELIIANQVTIPPPPSRVRPADAPRLPKALDKLVMRCLEKSKDNRPSRMTAINAIIQECLKRKPRMTRPYSAVSVAVAVADTDQGSPAAASPGPTTVPPAGADPVAGEAALYATHPGTGSAAMPSPPSSAAGLARTVPSEVAPMDAAKLAQEDPWQWRQVSKHARTLAMMIQASDHPAPPMADLLDKLLEDDKQFRALTAELAFPTARLKELEQAHRERTARLRHAVIDLSLERAREAEQRPADQARVRDLDYQIRALEERLSDAYQHGNQEAAGVAEEVSALEMRRDALERKRTQQELRLLELLRSIRLDTAPAEIAASFHELEHLLRG